MPTKPISVHITGLAEPEILIRDLRIIINALQEEVDRPLKRERDGQETIQLTHTKAIIHYEK